MKKQILEELLLSGCDRFNQKHERPSVRKCLGSRIFETQLAVILLHQGHSKSRISQSLRLHHAFLNGLDGFSQLETQICSKNYAFKKRFCTIAKRVKPEDRNEFIHDFSEEITA